MFCFGLVAGGFWALTMASSFGCFCVSGFVRGWNFVILRVLVWVVRCLGLSVCVVVALLYFFCRGLLVGLSWLVWLGRLGRLGWLC